MKTILRIFPAAILALATLSGCTDKWLYPESQTAPTSEFLFTNAEGLQKAIIGLYMKDRGIVYDSDENEGNGDVYVVTMMDYCTDLMVFRAGTAASFARLDNYKSDSGHFQQYWNRHYSIIGKANEIIARAKELDLSDPEVGWPYGEACLFRARSYFLLYQRFERLYLTTEPTTVDNAFGRTFRAASKEEIFTQIKADLAEAEKYLDWNYPQRGRLNKAVAKHIRAQVAMWEEDWDEAIKQVDEIFTKDTYHHMDTDTWTIFDGADLSSPEILYCFQYSQNPGGGNTVSGGVVKGHRISLVVTPMYRSEGGMIMTNEYGGYGWGRVYPNSYLLSLYDKANDRRYTDLFVHGYKFNDPKNAKYGQDYVPTKANYIGRGHPATKKYMDFGYTHPDEPDKTTSFKDMPVYRLAETALIGCEAYFHKDGPASTDALKYYNMTWERAGNAHFDGPLTLENILEETARECHFEGVRWNQLKRLGLLAERVRAHAGDSKADDPMLESDYDQPRKNFKDERDWRWPIPLKQLDQMPGFGQNPGW